MLLTSADLPEAARKALAAAHGGFAVDHRPGRGETYFARSGAGILRLDADMRQVALVATAAEMRDTNLHNTTSGYAREGTPFLQPPGRSSQ